MVEGKLARPSPKEYCLGLFRAIRWPWLVLPLIAYAVLAVLVCQGVPLFHKLTLEPIHIKLLAVFTAIAVVRLLIHRALFFLWYFLFVANFLTREIHFRGTSCSVFIVLSLLLLTSWWYADKLAPYNRDRTVVTLVALSLFTYFLSQSLDQRWYRWIPGERLFHVPVEEHLEALGHLFVGAIGVFSRSPARMKELAGQEQQPAVLCPAAPPVPPP